MDNGSHHSALTSLSGDWWWHWSFLRCGPFWWLWKHLNFKVLLSLLQNEDDSLQSGSVKMDIWATQPTELYIRPRYLYIIQWACLDLGNNYCLAIAVVLSTLLCAGFPCLFIFLAQLENLFKGFLHVNNWLLWLKLLLQNILLFVSCSCLRLPCIFLSYADVFSVLAVLWIQKNPMQDTEVSFTTEERNSAPRGRWPSLKWCLSLHTVHILVFPCLCN